MNHHIGFGCHICGKSLEENERLFSFEICIEYERDGAYDVDYAEGYLTICECCSVTYDVNARIYSETVALVEYFLKKKRFQAPNAHKITVINNRYDCAVCEQRIPNNSKIFTTSSGYERCKNGNLIPEPMELQMVTCFNCSKELDIKEKIKSIIDKLITECKKDSLRLI